MTSAALARCLYGALTDDPEPSHPARDGLGDAAVPHVARNFSLNAANGTATKLAEQLASPGAVLPLLLAAVSAPVGLVGLLEPIRRGASLAPQLVVAGRIRARARRRWAWVAAGATQAAALAAMALAAAVLDGAAAGAAVLAGLVVFSLASGVGSVAFSDVMGRTIPKSKRGQLLAVRATAGGVLTLVAGLALIGLSSSAGVGVFVGLLAGAAALWAIAAGLFAAIAEPPGEVAEGRAPLDEARAGLRDLRAVRGLRRFSVARGLLLAVEVAVPFLVVLARGRLGGHGTVLPAAVASIGAANLLSNVVWGRVADRASTRATMAVAGAVGAAGVAAGLGAWAAAGPGTTVLVFVPAFLLTAAAEAGIRVGRKAYVVNAAPEADRASWTAATNTLAGLVALALMALGLLAQLAGVAAAVWTLLALATLGVAAALATPSDRETLAEAGRRGGTDTGSVRIGGGG